MSFEADLQGDATEEAGAILTQDEVIMLMLDKLSDQLDHPELWPDIPLFAAHFGTLKDEIAQRMIAGRHDRLLLAILHTMCIAAEGDVPAALKQIEPLAVRFSLSPLVQGAVFYLQSLLEPENPRFDLSDRLCTTPFQVMDVLDGTTHLCCASWLGHSIGNMAAQDWQSVWNSPQAEAIRESIHDGSYRFCNKTACPHIGANTLPTKADVAARSPQWEEIVTREMTAMPEGPYRVNLAYDRTCNLSCPSCRTEKIASDTATRDRYDAMQETAILPMLRESKLVFITGSGDPFASKNFRQLMHRLGPEDYPDLRFQVMTNGMLFTRKEWDRFPALHERVAFLRISIDAATGPTHELLRRGARWEVMEDNLAFAAELRAQGKVDKLELAFTVQVDNYREMGDAVTLAESLGADHVDFLRLTNWGTFTAAQYGDKAVFMPSHPLHQDFLAHMRDPRLLHDIVRLSDLSCFAHGSEVPQALAS